MAANQRLRDIPKLSSDGKNLNAVMEAVREVLQTFRGYRGDELDRALTLRDLDNVTQRTVLAGGSLGGGGTTTIIGGGGGTGGGGGDVPDPTPPPTAEGLAVTAGLTYIYISHDVPVYTQGHGHQKTRVFGAKWPASDPTPPTFSEAVQIFEFEGPFGAYPTDTGTRWCIWIKWVSVDGYESVDPAGGTNGVQATTGKIGNADLNDLIITASKLADGAIDLESGKVTADGEFGAIAVGYTVTQYLVATSGVMQNLIVDNAQIANVSAGKIIAGSVGVGAYIQSTGYSAGVSGWRIHGNGFAEFGAAAIRGQLTAAQVNANGLSIRDPSGNIILDASATPALPWRFLSDSPGPNLIKNPEFIGDSGSSPRGWARVLAGTPPTGLVFTTTSSPTYGTPWNLNAPFLHSGLNAANQSVRWQTDDFIPVSTTENYTVACWARTFSGTTRCYLRLFAYDAAGTQLGTVDPSPVVASNISTTWTRYSGVVGPDGTALPAGTTQVKVVWQHFNGASALTGNAFATRFTFNQGKVPTNSYAPFDPTALAAWNPLTAGNISVYMEAAAISAAYIGSLNADVINAGAIRGINVNASSHTTVGSYLTASAAAAATTLQVKDTTDFPASGTAFIMDATNDRDTITYTGKTATSLTGCSGVLAHGVGATIIPRTKAMVIDARTNEMRYFGDRGDGVVEEIANIGTVPAALGGDGVVAKFGSLVAGADNDAVVAYSNSGWGVRGESVSSFGLLGVSGQNVGVRGGTSSTNTVHAGVQGLSGGGASVGVEGLASSTGPAVRGVQSGSGPGVFGDATSGPGVSGSSSTGYGAEFFGNNTRGPIFLEPRATAPTNLTLGQLCFLNSSSAGSQLCFTRPAGSYGPAGWYKVNNPTQLWNL